MADVLDIPKEESDIIDTRYCSWAWNWNDEKEAVYLFPDEPTFIDDNEYLKKIPKD